RAARNAARAPPPRSRPRRGAPAVRPRPPAPAARHGRATGAGRPPALPRASPHHLRRRIALSRRDARAGRLVRGVRARRVLVAPRAGRRAAPALWRLRAVARTTARERSRSPRARLLAQPTGGRLGKPEAAGGSHTERCPEPSRLDGDLRALARSDRRAEGSRPR